MHGFVTHSVDWSYGFFHQYPWGFWTSHHENLSLLYCSSPSWTNRRKSFRRTFLFLYIVRSLCCTKTDWFLVPDLCDLTLLCHVAVDWPDKLLGINFFYAEWGETPVFIWIELNFLKLEWDPLSDKGRTPVTIVMQTRVSHSNGSEVQRVNFVLQKLQHTATRWSSPWTRTIPGWNCVVKWAHHENAQETLSCKCKTIRFRINSLHLCTYQILANYCPLNTNCKRDTSIDIQNNDGLGCRQALRP